MVPSSSLFSLTYLSYLDLSFNNFMYSNIPTGLANLTRLSYLNLSNAMFSGSITTQFFNLTSSLRWLDISCSYRVPDYLPLSPYLSSTVQVRSGVYYSYLIGGNLSLSSLNFLLGLHNLRELKLSGVDLKKTSQSTKWAEPLIYLSNLQKLELSNCRISKFQSLEVLKLGFNRFQGRIPQFIGALQNLHILVLESNFFNGSIPWEITKLEKLQYVDFSSNKLSCPIPENLNGLKMLKTRPQDGSILGFFISSMFAAVELTVTMKGLLQHYVIVRSYHSGIDLSYNCLTGNIPTEIGTLEGLPMVNLSHNCLRGEI
ncbi:probable LRR receptor-like serine/threonine-protein kinase IRK [Pistacia vera]|uniref:probable LRR receptor-like serine/threonine-protein kinase IRK n=1 Tax=Pistacia vera TaxID=55513 RepID=UPI0012633F9C|nr:probable LRR receptor-like serine/threonine-protein kinase IRK [Pistacia vera]